MTTYKNFYDKMNDKLKDLNLGDQLEVEFYNGGSVLHFGSSDGEGMLTIDIDKKQCCFW